MDQILSLLVENKVIIGTVVIALILGGPKVKDLVVSLLKSVSTKIPSFKSSQLVDEELLDQHAIRRLRDRANEFADEALIKDIKAIDSKFYDIHAKGNKKDA